MRWYPICPEIFGNTQEYLELLNCWALHTTEAEDSKTCESRISGQWLCLMCVFMLRVFALYMWVNWKLNFRTMHHVPAAILKAYPSGALSLKTSKTNMGESLHINAKKYDVYIKPFLINDFVLLPCCLALPAGNGWPRRSLFSPVFAPDLGTAILSLFFSSVSLLLLHCFAPDLGIIIPSLFFSFVSSFLLFCIGTSIPLLFFSPKVLKAFSPQTFLAVYVLRPLFYPRAWHCNLLFFCSSFLFHSRCFLFLFLHYTHFLDNKQHVESMVEVYIFVTATLIFCISYFLLNKQHVECMVEVYMWAMKYRVAEISGILPIFQRILDSCQNRNIFSEYKSTEAGWKNKHCKYKNSEISSTSCSLVVLGSFTISLWSLILPHKD